MLRAPLRTRGNLTHACGLHFSLYGVEGFSHFAIRFAVKHAAEIDRNRGKKESGNDFIEPKPSEMVPNEHRGGTHHHAAERAHAGHALPPEGDENHGTKGCAKASPGVRDQ